MQLLEEQLTGPTSVRLGLVRSNRPNSLRRGGQLLEMAVCFSVLVSLSMGLVEFGQYFYIKHSFESAVRDGLRYGIQSTATQSQMVSTISTTLAQSNVTYNAKWLTLSDLTAGTSVSDIGQVPAGDIVQMKLSTTYTNLPAAVRPLNSITGLGIGNGKTITVVCVMAKE